MLVDLIRHGPTEAPGLLLGRTDPAPSPAAWPQLARQTEGRAWSAIVTSPLARCRTLAKALADERRLSPRIDADWQELDFGDWDGIPVETLRADPDIAMRLDALYAQTNASCPPNGESWRALETRIARALSALFEQDAAEDAVAVITHGGPIRAALSLACGLPFVHTWAFRIDYGTRITLRVERTDDATIWGEIVEIAQP